MQGHGCNVNLSHIRRLSWHILQDSWGVNLWKMSLSVVFVRYPAGLYCSRWWNHYATSEKKKEKKRKRGNRSRLDRRRLQGEICLNEQVANTQRCLVLLHIIKKKEDKRTTVGSLTNGWVITYMAHAWKAAAEGFMSGIKIGCSVFSVIQCILKRTLL